MTEEIIFMKILTTGFKPSVDDVVQFVAIKSEFNGEYFKEVDRLVLYFNSDNIDKPSSATSIQTFTEKYGINKEFLDENAEKENFTNNSKILDFIGPIKTIISFGVECERTFFEEHFTYYPQFEWKCIMETIRNYKNTKRGTMSENLKHLKVSFVEDRLKDPVYFIENAIIMCNRIIKVNERQIPWPNKDESPSIHQLSEIRRLIRESGKPKVQLSKILRLLEHPDNSKYTTSVMIEMFKNSTNPKPKFITRLGKPWTRRLV